MRCLLTALIAAWAAFGQQGVPPRPAAGDYQANRDTPRGAVAASIVPSDAVSKLFASEVARKYVVIEVAVYPKAGESFDLHALDFALTTGAETRSLPATPDEVAAVRRESHPSLPGGVNVIGEAGIGYGTATNPATGQKEHSLGTYTGVGVDNRPRPVSTNSGPDPYTLQAKLDRLALPETNTGKIVSGYLYFPVLKKSKGMAYHLQYSTDGMTIELSLPPLAR